MSGQAYEQLTLFPADSPASPSPWLESKRAKGMIDTSGRRCYELSPSCARAALSVRTYLESSRLPPGRWSRIWSVLAITSSCLILRLRLSELGTGDRECFSLRPTPNTMDALPPKSPEALKKEMTVSRPGRKQPCNLRDWVAVQEGGEPVADAACERIQRHAAICAAKPAERSGKMQSDAESGNGADVCNTVCARLQNRAAEAVRKPGPREQHQRSGWWAAEPDVGRVAHGIPARVDRLKCLGNAVVPQQAYPIFKALMEELNRWTRVGCIE